MDIHEFLKLPHRFRWGGHGGDDCIMFCASWVANQTGVDPAEKVRGTYRDEEGALAFVARSGGLIPMIDTGVKPLGYLRTNEPVTGDIGVVLAPSDIDGKVKEIGAIRFGPLWAVLAPAGVRAHRYDFVAAWSRGAKA
ncbi:DUF6950 family protein [Rhizobium gallicum]|uniref:DUF6950 family protein n=1 Tax=Rhizobium gallicum TaxID=56730 RepID=UPI001EF8ADFD|nr:hypothetical protein [Rhizobium gallicum]ULJ73586.1 hypothetical protein L2W42_08435 [Rhizobium gallicum]